MATVATSAVPALPVDLAGNSAGNASAASAVGASSSASTGALATVPQRPGGGKKWSEVCERVQQPDGSVRTSPPFKSGAAPSAASPPRPRPGRVGSHGLGVRRLSAGPAGVGNLVGDHVSKTLSRGPSSRGGSSRGDSSRGGSSRGGSSGKSSRSSSRDVARDGDISSRCSSGCWETSTNSSEPSRPRSPPDVGASPSVSKGLLMPDPIRTGIILPPALLDDSPEAAMEAKAMSLRPHGEAEVTIMSAEAGVDDAGPSTAATSAETRPGMPLKWDPYGRDAPRQSQVKAAWSVEPLIKYLKTVVYQIATNVQDKKMPSADKLDAYVSRLVANTWRQLKHAPRKTRHVLQATFSRRFQKFWNFVRNEKVRPTTPEELKGTLILLIEALQEFTTSPEVVVQPKPIRSVPNSRILVDVVGA